MRVRSRDRDCLAEVGRIIDDQYSASSEFKKSRKMALNVEK